MGWHMDDWSWGGWLLMTAMMVAFWGLVAWVVVMAIRANRAVTPQSPEPEGILGERFARGEIDEDEYLRRLNALRHGTKTP